MSNGITIKDAILQLEDIRKSTVISYMASQNALVGPEDAGMLVDTIEMILPAARKFERLDLFLHSPGGFLDSAYKIIRICKEYSNEFNVIVPLAAKSAATVICLGANEIVMTVFAELGPIDPIIQHPYKPDVRVPARSIKDFFAFLNSTETEKILVDPQFKTQMSSLLDPYLIGSYQTALNSSKQIAEKLLKENALKSKPTQVDEAVKKLTEFYYSHSYVIDRNEAREIGLNVINAESTPNLDHAIRQLLGIYQQFMMQNNILKLIGNRELNRNIQAVIAPQNVNPARPVNLIF
ncbi:MAG: peptidase [Candidatus Omnitrophica bacterium]|nr:peptidase [Candidatus Omnitrophota bacterium]MDD5610945.1 peptidase [Candidatus Omnitrophota bacterium]